MSVARVAVVGGLALLALLVVLVVTGGSATHRYKLIFTNAGQLV